MSKSGITSAPTINSSVSRHPDQRLKATCRAYEYGSKTPSGTTINLATRASWVKRLSSTEAATYTKSNVLGGWVPPL
jgi:hypothetical protein